MWDDFYGSSHTPFPPRGIGGDAGRGGFLCANRSREDYPRPSFPAAKRQQHPSDIRWPPPRRGDPPSAHAAATARDSGLGGAHHAPRAPHGRTLSLPNSYPLPPMVPSLPGRGLPRPPRRPVSGMGYRRGAARCLPAGPALPFFFFLRFFLAPSSAPRPAAPPSAPSLSSGSSGSSPLRCFSASAAAPPACPTPAMSPRPRRLPHTVGARGTARAAGPALRSMASAGHAGKAGGLRRGGAEGAAFPCTALRRRWAPRRTGCSPLYPCPSAGRQPLSTCPSAGRPAGCLATSGAVLPERRGPVAPPFPAARPWPTVARRGAPLGAGAVAVSAPVLRPVVSSLPFVVPTDAQGCDQVTVIVCGVGFF